MMKTVKVSELTGAALDWGVTKCETGQPLDCNGPFLVAFNYSTDWALGGPLIEREMIQLTPKCLVNPLHGWAAAYRSFDEDDDVYALHRQRGKTPLIAAMRCYVKSRLGGTIEVPEKLL